MKYKLPETSVVSGTVLSIEGPLDFAMKGDYGYVFKCKCLRDFGLHTGDRVCLTAEIDSSGEAIVLHVSEVFEVNETVL